MVSRRKNRWECKEMTVCSHGLKKGLYMEHLRELTKALCQVYADENERLKSEKILVENEKLSFKTGHEVAQEREAS